MRRGTTFGVYGPENCAEKPDKVAHEAQNGRETELGAHRRMATGTEAAFIIASGRATAEVGSRRPG